jgi:hypothetical protein
MDGGDSYSADKARLDRMTDQPYSSDELERLRQLRATVAGRHERRLLATIDAQRAALAAQPLFVGTIRDLLAGDELGRQWPLDHRVVVYPASAGSATPTQPDIARTILAKIMERGDVSSGYLDVTGLVPLTEAESAWLDAVAGSATPTGDDDA